MRAVVALGANMQDPRECVELAITLLSQATDLIARSSLYETKPVGGPPQDDFINAVCIVETALPPADFLKMLHGIEKSMSREREQRWGPRVIDCDLITFGELVSTDMQLTLPHPQAHLRRFVLEPWLEIDPMAHLPMYGSVEEILAHLPRAE